MRRYYQFLKHCLIFCGMALFSDAAFGADPAGKLYSIEGKVEVKSASDPSWQPATAQTVFNMGDAVRTGDASRAAIIGADGLMVRLSSNALLEFKDDPSKGGRGFNLDAGKAHFLSRDPHAISNVTTTIVSGSIRGTEFAVDANPALVTFSVIEGIVDLKNQAGGTTLGSGEAADTSPGKAPVKRILVNPYDAVQWTLKYPALISDEAFKGSPGYGAYKNGEKNAAYEILRSSGNPRDLLFAAGIALEAGDLRQAETFHERIAQFPNLDNDWSAIYWAQKSILHVVQNKRAEASNDIGLAFKRNPKNVEALFASSVEHQGRGDIAGAKEQIARALQIEPDNSRLQARLAELVFGSGDTKAAAELLETTRADSAGKNDPDSERVYGFVLLSRGEIEKAEEIFTQDIDSGRGSAESHLGLGLVRFRQGDKEAGRIEIQKAAHLEPNVSLYRSYLGKAFFETNKESQALKDLVIAKDLDPKDPTPYLYDAFNKLALFRPVDALADLEDSIERNNNRAVYRSRLLLDQDHATRAAGLGRIFNALDFVRPAKIEAQKSLTEDPSNYSAHLLFKDSLVGGGTSGAFISADTTATLLTPATFNSLLATVSSSATLNEYTSLFERAQSRTIIDFIGQSEESLLETSAAHLTGGENYSILARYGMSYSDGYRNNDFSRRHTGRLLAQYDITPDDKILAEGIFLANEQGDTYVDLDPNGNDPDFSTKLDDVTGRLGYHHTWSASSHTIAQALFVNSNSRLKDLSANRLLPVTFTLDDATLTRIDDTGLFDSRSRLLTQGMRSDVQHLWSTGDLSLVTGGSILGFTERQRDRSNLTSDSEQLFTELPLESQGKVNAHALRAYSYLTVKPVSWFRGVAGANYSQVKFAPRLSAPFDSTSVSDNSWSPKVGAMFYPSDTVTIRSAYFESLGGASVRDLEGIEPAQVAGIRQSFDDPVGAKSKNWGTGIDWKLPKSTYVGAEFLYRKVRNSGLNLTDTFTYDTVTQVLDSALEQSFFAAENEEKTVAGYLNKIITSTLVGSIEYDWTQTNNNFFDYQLETNRTRLGVNYYDPSGFFLFSSGTWRNQHRAKYIPEVSNSSDFWIISGGIGYQLPHRRGSIQLAVRNIFDRAYTYVPTSQDVTFYPGADVSLGVHLNF